MTTELTNLGITNPSPSTSIASLDVNNGLIVRSLADMWNNEQPLIYLCRGSRNDMPGKHHRISGQIFHINALNSYLKFQIHDGSDTTGNTLVDTLKSDMNGDATVNRNILLNGTVTGMTNIYTKMKLIQSLLIILDRQGQQDQQAHKGQVVRKDQQEQLTLITFILKHKLIHH